jgi:hypothetical protein
LLQAAEVQPSGQLQFQGNYFDTPLAEGSHWQVAMPDGRFGVTAAEPLAASALIGHWQVAIDPLAEGDEVVLRPHQAYLNWRRGIVSLWGGRLATVEQTFLVDLSSNLVSQSQKGLAVGSVVDSLMTPSENKAIRVDLASGDALVVTSQWVIDDEQPDAQWSGATVLRTPEGVIALTVRNVPNRSPIWGNLIQWNMGNAVFSGVWLYRDELLAWDFSARSQRQSLQTFVAYRVLGDEEGRWSVGIQQAASESMTGFSEVYWLPAGQGWQWSTGFQIRF